MRMTLNNKRAMVGWSLANHHQMNHLLQLVLELQTIRARRQICQSLKAIMKVLELK